MELFLILCSIVGAFFIVVAYIRYECNRIRIVHTINDCIKEDNIKSLVKTIAQVEEYYDPSYKDMFIIDVDFINKHYKSDSDYVGIDIMILSKFDVLIGMHYHKHPINVLFSTKTGWCMQEEITKEAMINHYVIIFKNNIDLDVLEIKQTKI